MCKLTEEQVKKLAEKYGITEQEVLENQKVLIETTAFQFEILKEQALKIWNQLKPSILKMVNGYNIHIHEQKVKFFKKKKSQSKKWKKWKKRL